MFQRLSEWTKVDKENNMKIHSYYFERRFDKEILNKIASNQASNTKHKLINSNIFSQQ